MTIIIYLWLALSIYDRFFVLLNCLTIRFYDYFKQTNKAMQRTAQQSELIIPQYQFIFGENLAHNSLLLEAIKQEMPNNAKAHFFVVKR